MAEKRTVSEEELIEHREAYVGNMVKYLDLAIVGLRDALAGTMGLRLDAETNARNATHYLGAMSKIKADIKHAQTGLRWCDNNVSALMLLEELLHEDDEKGGDVPVDEE